MEPYEKAGLSPTDMHHLTNLIAAVYQTDATAPWVAVDRADILGVVSIVDRLVDREATQ